MRLTLFLVKQCDSLAILYSDIFRNCFESGLDTELPIFKQIDININIGKHDLNKLKDLGICIKLPIFEYININVNINTDGLNISRDLKTTLNLSLTNHTKKLYNSSIKTNI